MISEIATGFPGYDAILPDSAATIGTILKDNGYNTAWFGKNHNTPDYETSQAGPFDQWPTGMGFEYFFGFNGGDTNQWAPALIENTKPIEPPTNDPKYHFMTDMTDRSIAWIRNQKSMAPNKPFFVYFAPGATHAPHHVPKEWADKFKGQFDEGWNKVSEATFDRMKAMHIIPPAAKYNPIPGEVGVWDELTPDQKKVYARMMEVYAGFLAFTDHETGRLLHAVNDLGISENTLVQTVGWPRLKADDVEKNRQLEANCLRQMAYRALSTDTRSWYLSQALELEGNTPIIRSVPAVPAAVSTNLADYVNYYRVRVSPDRSAETDKMLGLQFDGDRAYGLHVRRSVVDFVPDLAASGRKPDVTVSMTPEVWTAVFNNLADPADLIDKGSIKVVQGDAAEAKSLFAMFDPVYDWKNDKALQAIAEKIKGSFDGP